MSAITNLSDLINLMTGGGSANPQNLFFWKDARVAGAASAATIAGRYTSLWQYEGTPSHGAAPGGSVRVPDNATVGGLLQTDPGGGRQLWLGGFGVTPGSGTGTLILYDRLLDISGFSGTTITAQNVGGSITRYTNGLGNQIWVEIYTQIGATSRTITANYTDDAGNTGQTSSAAVIGNTGFREAQRIIPISLASGDKGVRAVASVTLSATTGTAGDFGVVIAHPLAYIPLPLVGTGCLVDFVSGLPGLTEILTDACLGLAWVANGTTQPVLIGHVNILEK